MDFKNIHDILSLFVQQTFVEYLLLRSWDIVLNDNKTDMVLALLELIF